MSVRFYCHIMLSGRKSSRCMSLIQGSCMYLSASGCGSVFSWNCDSWAVMMTDIYWQSKKFRAWIVKLRLQYDSLCRQMYLMWREKVCQQTTVKKSGIYYKINDRMDIIYSPSRVIECISNSICDIRTTKTIMFRRLISWL